MTSNAKATGHVCQRIEGRQYRLSWINPNGKPASKVTDAAGAVRFCERHNVTILPPTGAAQRTAVARGEEGKTSPPYWLCCGSLNFHEHHRRVCQATPEICRWGTADDHAAWQKSRPDIVFKFPQKLTTSPERVQIPAESKHVRCPKCPAHMPVGKWCGGAQCPLRK